jgi:urease accessory protein
VSVRRWQANLDLAFAHREPRTVLASNLHSGPLQVQKALYPEGPGICHVAVLHPPGGVVAGDSLTLSVRLDARSRACLTTPGAAKWYRCVDGHAEQQLRFAVGRGAALEWLPRESILFDASRVHLGLDVDLAADAAFFGWEILCLGRRASGEGWRSGGLSTRSAIRRDGRLLWLERGHVAADSGFGASPAGLAGCSVSGTFVVAGPDTAADVLSACRAVSPRDPLALCGITSLPGVLLARYLGHKSEDAFNWFSSLWKLLRPAHLNITATPPRLWAC